MLPTPKKNSSTRDTIATRSENSPKTETAASESSAKPSPAKADMLALWHRVKTASASCDEANAHVADSLELLGKSTSIYTAYELTDSAYNICRESWWDLTQLEVTDSIEGDAADELKKALENCSNAYWLRKRSLDKLKTVLNGDMRPSALQDYKGDAQAAQGGVMACVAGMMGAGLKVGIDVKDFK